MKGIFTNALFALLILSVVSTSLEASLMDTSLTDVVKAIKSGVSNGSKAIMTVTPADIANSLDRSATNAIEWVAHNKADAAFVGAIATLIAAIFYKAYKEDKRRQVAYAQAQQKNELEILVPVVAYGDGSTNTMVVYSN